MLLDDFYRVIDKSENKNNLNIIFLINPNHNIFNGHFPGQPVVPGVIQLQIIKEILETHLDKKMIIHKITQVKYLTPIIPDEKTKINLNIIIRDISENSIKIDATFSSKDILFTKAKLEISKLS